MKRIGLVLIALSLLTATGFAEETKPAMTPEQQAKMAEIKKYMEPNEHHKALEPLIGQWKAKLQCWMDPQGQPELSEGTINNYWIMGGRFVQQDFKGVAMGQPFEGMGITGYDTIRAEYTSIWLDSMATGIMVSTGQLENGALSQSGTMSCPLTMEKARAMRSVWKIIDANHNTYEMYMTDPKTGQEYKGMEISCERVQ